MNEQVKDAVYRGLSDSLSAAIDTGNAEEVSRVLDDACNSHDATYITSGQFEGLLSDARVAGYDY